MTTEMLDRITADAVTCGLIRDGHQMALVRLEDLRAILDGVKLLETERANNTKLLEANAKLTAHAATLQTKLVTAAEAARTLVLHVAQLYAVDAPYAVDAHEKTRDL